MSGAGISASRRSGGQLRSLPRGRLQARNPAIWGSGTTACASDSKHFGAWDQNLTTQWHVRYGGRGLLIYSHAPPNSLVIPSPLKAPAPPQSAPPRERAIPPSTQTEVH